MLAKYAPFTRRLVALAAAGREIVEFGFAEVPERRRDERLELPLLVSEVSVVSAGQRKRHEVRLVRDSAASQRRGPGGVVQRGAQVRDRVADDEPCACREVRPCRSVASASCRSSSGMIAAVLVRFAYLAVSHAFAALWLLRMTDREKDVEILALRHQRWWPTGRCGGR
ncbi:hypothetical protein [Lentzea kentuckyensis]|uniref:hypothetical protein n=1 Tax=Lentzea kentuckyensis TaxID=360086 RepID=UPI001179E0A2|nr:hypothetical protein [Lentzea kentuckyensis]